jgi:hypothetical protein
MDSEGVFAGPETVSFLEGFGKSQKNKSKFSVMKKNCHKIYREWSQMKGLVALITAMCGMLQLDKRLPRYKRLKFAVMNMMMLYGRL